MAILPIMKGEKNTVLRTKTKDVKKVTKEILTLLQDMEDTMLDAKGAGIAAPQVGRLERVCLVILQQRVIPLINPHITWRSEKTDIAEEGCLSLPDVWIQVRRPIDIVVEFLTPLGKKLELKLSGFDARVVQHEVDHLEGVLITDYQGETHSKEKVVSD